MQRLMVMLGIVALLICGGGPTSAEEVTFHLSGSVNGTTTHLVPYFDAGDPVTITYTFESNATDYDEDPAFGKYRFAILSFDLKVGNYSYHSTAGPISVYDEFYGVPGYDSYSVSIHQNIYESISGPLLAGAADIRNISFSMSNHPLPGTNVLSDDSLPVVPPEFDLTPVNSNSGQLCFWGAGTACVSFQLYSFGLMSNWTPEGPNVEVHPPAVDEAGNLTGETPITLQFEDVSFGGSTTVTVMQAGEPPLYGLKLGSPPTYFDIDTTATFSGPVMVCIDYSGISFGSELTLTLQHYTGSEWVDVTAPGYPNTENNLICGEVEDFSLFAPVEPADPAELLAALVGKVVVMNLQKGIANSLDAKLETSLGALNSANESNDIAATNAMQAFINAVEAQAGNHLSANEAAELIFSAEEIIATIGAP